MSTMRVVDPTTLNNNDILNGYTARYWNADGSRIFRDHFQDIFAELFKWDEQMARKTYRIELKIDFDDTKNHEIMLGIAKQYARDLLGSAMLLQDGRKPAVALITDDSFHGTDEIDLMDQSQTIHAE